jgi:hypothetical protein
MLNAAVDVADHFICVDLASRRTVKIGNSGRRHLQPFQLLLADRVGNSTHIALNVSFGKRGHRLGPLLENNPFGRAGIEN